MDHTKKEEARRMNMEKKQFWMIYIGNTLWDGRRRRKIGKKMLK